MKEYTIVHTSNVVKALEAMRCLLDRTAQEEGMGLLFGRPGEGKTTAISYLANQFNGVFLRANVTWTVTSMLGAIMMELGLEPLHRRAPMMEASIKALIMDKRPLFIDEADYCLRNTDMLDGLRDIYDSAGVPVVLITMETAPRTIRTKLGLARFRRRITQWIEFSGLTLADAIKIAKTLVDVEMSHDLVARVHRETSGNIGQMINAFVRIEKLAKTNGLERVDMKAYGARALLPHGGQGVSAG